MSLQEMQLILKGNSIMTNSKTPFPTTNIKEIQNLADIPENFESQEAAEDFWDVHALSLDALRELPEEPDEKEILNKQEQRNNPWQ